MSCATSRRGSLPRRGLTLVLGENRARRAGTVVVATVADALAVLRSGRVDLLRLEPGAPGIEPTLELLRAIAACSAWPRHAIQLGTQLEPHPRAVGALITGTGAFVAVPGDPLRYERAPTRVRPLGRPLLLLDVDGVLCPFGAGTPGLRSALAGGQPVRYDPALVDGLRRLGRSFELVWATMWEHAANECIAPLFGLSQLPVISFDDGYARGDTWKLAAVARFAGARACAWIDDALGSDAHAWAAHRAPPTLLLDIDARTGLRVEHVEQLLEFASDADAHLPTPSEVIK